jgi:micrococcal nuclease
MYTYSATITDVHDGDTATAIVDLGFRVKMQIKIRLYGINAPEMRGETKEAGKDSQVALSNMILNKNVTIVTRKDKQEKYGRWLAHIVTEDGLNVNEEMIKLGKAIKYMEN